MQSKDTAAAWSGESRPGAGGEALLPGDELLLLLPALLTREWDFQSEPVHTPFLRMAGYGLMATAVVRELEAQGLAVAGGSGSGHHRLRLAGGGGGWNFRF
jgi:hypothetical protein